MIIEISRRNFSALDVNERDLETWAVIAYGQHDGESFLVEFDKGGHDYWVPRTHKWLSGGLGHVQADEMTSALGDRIYDRLCRTEGVYMSPVTGTPPG